MKFLNIFAPFVLPLALLWSLALLAQDTNIEDLTLEQALANVRAVYGDVLIIEINFDEDGESQREEACWKFHFVDGSEVCVIAASGEIVVDDSNTPNVVVTEDVQTTPGIVVTEDLDDSFCVDDDNDGDSGRGDDNSGSDDDDDGDDNSDDGDSGRGDDDNDDCDDFTGVAPLVTLENAIALARGINPNTRISSVELELLNDGRLIWEIDFDGANNDVDVDANSGQIVDISGDDDNNDDDGDSGRGDDDNDGDSGRGDDDDDDNGGDDNSGSGSGADDDNGDSGRGDDNSGSGGSGDNDDDGDSGRGGSNGGSGGSD